MFKLVDSAPRLRGQRFEPDPDEEGTADMVPLNPRGTTLAAFEPGELFPFAVQLLNVPTKATHLSGRLRGMLSGIVGYDPIRAVGRHRNPEQAHLMVFGKAFDLDPLTVRQLRRVPLQRVYPP